MRIKTDLTLRPDASVRAGFLRLVDKLVQRVVDRNLTPGCDPSEDVHSVRTTIKRLRTILRLIRPGITKTVFERENLRLKEVAHRLSLARDRQVARHTLPTLALFKQAGARGGGCGACWPGSRSPLRK